MLLLIDISNMQILPFTEILEDYLDFNQEESGDQTYALSNMYQLMGYETSFFLSAFT